MSNTVRGPLRAVESILVPTSIKFVLFLASLKHQVLEKTHHKPKTRNKTSRSTSIWSLE